MKDFLYLDVNVVLSKERCDYKRVKNSKLFDNYIKDKLSNI